MCKNEEREEMVSYMARMLEDRTSFVFDLSNGERMKINRQEVQRYEAVYDRALREVDDAGLRRRISDAAENYRSAMSSQDVGFGCAFGCLLSGQSVEATRAILRTFGLYPQGG